MPRRITLKPHLTTTELYRRYRACRHPQEKLRWRALHLISGGELANHAARRVGRSSGWISDLARRYNERGVEAVPDARGGDAAPGRRPRLDSEAAQALDAALRVSPADGGLWTAPKVVAWIEARTGTSVNQSTAWRVMRRLGFTLQVPRPHHARAASVEEQATFKKSSLTRSPLSNVRTRKTWLNSGHRTKRVWA